MRKFLTIFYIVIIVVLSVIIFNGCNKNDENNKSSISQSEINNQMLNEYEVDVIYLVTISLKEKHTFLEFDKKLKDSANKQEFPIPVSKEYYDSIKIGDKIENSFRWGSFWIEGSLSSWDVEISKKETITRT